MSLKGIVFADRHAIRRGMSSESGSWFPPFYSRRVDDPFVVLLERDRAGEADEGVIIGEDADDPGPALDFAVEALDRVGRVQLDEVLLREGHVGENGSLGIIHEWRRA